MSSLTTDLIISPGYIYVSKSALVASDSGNPPSQILLHPCSWTFGSWCTTNRLLSLTSQDLRCHWSFWNPSVKAWWDLSYPITICSSTCVQFSNFLPKAFGETTRWALGWSEAFCQYTCWALLCIIVYRLKSSNRKYVLQTDSQPQTFF